MLGEEVNKPLSLSILGTLNPPRARVILNESLLTIVPSVVVTQRGKRTMSRTWYHPALTVHRAAWHHLIAVLLWAVTATLMMSFVNRLPAHKTVATLNGLVNSIDVTNAAGTTKGKWCSNLPALWFSQGPFLALSVAGAMAALALVPIHFGMFILHVYNWADKRSLGAVSVARFMASTTTVAAVIAVVGTSLISATIASKGYYIANKIGPFIGKGNVDPECATNESLAWLSLFFGILSIGWQTIVPYLLQFGKGGSTQKGESIGQHLFMRLLVVGCMFAAIIFGAQVMDESVYKLGDNGENIMLNVGQAVAGLPATTFTSRCGAPALALSPVGPLMIGNDKQCYSNAIYGIDRFYHSKGGWGYQGINGWAITMLILVIVLCLAESAVFFFSHEKSKSKWVNFFFAFSTFLCLILSLHFIVWGNPALFIGYPFQEFVAALKPGIIGWAGAGGGALTGDPATVTTKLKEKYALLTLVFAALGFHLFGGFSAQRLTPPEHEHAPTSATRGSADTSDDDIKDPLMSGQKAAGNAGGAWPMYRSAA